MSHLFSSSETEDGLSIGAKIGIGVGVAGAVVIIIIIVVVLCGRNKIKRSLKEKSKEKNPYDMTYQYVGPYNGGSDFFFFSVMQHIFLKFLQLKIVRIHKIKA